MVDSREAILAELNPVLLAMEKVSSDRHSSVLRRLEDLKSRICSLENQSDASCCSVYQLEGFVESIKVDLMRIQHDVSRKFLFK